jgi:hypothetical protein
MTSEHRKVLEQWVEAIRVAALGWDAVSPKRAAALQALLADNERLRAESVTERRFTDDYIKLLHKAEAKIKAALALHKPGIWTGTIKCCVACSVKRTGPTLWPCPTVKALRGGDDAE